MGFGYSNNRKAKKMTDSQDLMNRELRFTTTAEERKIIRERLNKLTTLKRGVAMTTLTGKINNNLSKCGCIGNKLNTNNGSKTLFFRSLVHTNDQTEKYLNKGGVNKL